MIVERELGRGLAPLAVFLSPRDRAQPETDTPLKSTATVAGYGNQSGDGTAINAYTKCRTLIQTWAIKC